MIEIEVAAHFNEDAFSHGLALGMADRLREELRDVRCAEHGEHPVVRLSTQGIAQTVNDISVEVTGCCPEAVERVRALVAHLQEPPP